MDNNKINIYAEIFNNYCKDRNKKSNIDQMRKAITLRISTIICKAIYRIEDTDNNSLDVFFTKFKFPYNENSFKKMISDVYDYHMDKSEIFEYVKDIKDAKIKNQTQELLIELDEMLNRISYERDINFLKKYYDNNNINESLSYDQKLVLIEFLYEYVFTFVLVKRKSYKLMDSIFKHITLPKDTNSFNEFKNQINDKGFSERIDKIIDQHFNSSN